MATATATAATTTGSRPGFTIRASAAQDDNHRKIKLFGSAGSRSPIVNWLLHEAKVDFEDAPISNPENAAANPHPFGQIPCLVPESGEAIFESGACLMYLADRYGNLETPEQRAEVLKWIIWANASLDPILFIETPTGRVKDTGLKRNPPPRAIGRLEDILSKQNYLVGDAFTAADVAVGGYLLYIPLFFRGESVIV